MNAINDAPPSFWKFGEEKTEIKHTENIDHFPVVKLDNESDIHHDDKKDKEKPTDSPCEVLQSELSTELSPTLQERFVRIKQKVKDAINAHHTFMIYGRAKVIRETLLKRGWCEKLFRRNSNVEQYLNVESNPVILLRGMGDLKDQQNERQLISRMLSNHTVDFLWNTGSEWPGWPSQENKTTVFNRYYRAGFTSKIGLCSNVRQMHWYYEAGVANTLFPRCYNLCQGDQMHAFIEDFRFTACLSLLKWLVDKIDTEGENATRSPTGTIPLKALDFAIKRCSDYISAQSHEDIDRETEKIWSHQWDQFIAWYYKIVQDDALFIRNNVPFHKYFLAARHLLKKIKKYWPQIDMDGIMNVWILKPGNKSRGRGIVLMNKLDHVIAKVNPSTKADARYVVQKYIERPLLIYSTKFDIRQWFIVTCAQPLTLWMFKESYLRFCSQKFCLTDFHESIHLCNHAVQCKYKNCVDRDPALPVDNMWDATTFKEYLKSLGHGNAWDEQIYPGMKQGLVGSLLASQEAMDRRKNSFELYGADFMVMDDFSVWLIEINSHPDMSYSSSVTTRLCRQVMEDTIKVVVDYKENKNADTGQFELAYKQRMPSCQPYLGAALSLQGTRIPTSEKKSNWNLHDSKTSLTSKTPVIPLAKKKSVVHSQIGPVIVDLIEELEIQLDQEFYSYYKNESPKHRQALPATAPVIPITSKSSVPLEKPDRMSKSTSAGTVRTRACTKQSRFDQNHSKITYKEKSSNQKMTKKIRGSPIMTNANHEVSSPKQTLLSKIMALQQQSSYVVPKGNKSLKRNEEKIIHTAVRDAMKKYKRTANIPVNVPPLPSLLTPRNKVVQIPTTKHKSRTNSKKTNEKRNKVLTDVPDMFALGLNLMNK
ncbi:PREDICTED: tubulin glycylase 3A-like isoform X1 [Polistes canadensis]|uniref:tubulin glycylase 3A-like isoform X1 n=1 Tax=Polistes canadensis TaxID=91411 RepID=UPI000718AE3D|nr:PREDICTED: tubulin glycylase 3A-like isoform X1 [Polistes canadensis]